MPPPPSAVPVRPRRRRALPVLVGVATLVAGGVAAWTWLRVPAGEPTRDGAVASRGDGPALAGAGAGGVVALDPWAPPGPMTTDELRAGLAARLAARRVAVLKDVVARGGVDREALPDVEALTTDGDPLVALWAKGAAAKLAGDRRYVLELARVAAQAPGLDDVSTMLRALDPTTAEALVRAVALELDAKRRSTRGVEGLDDAIARLARDPEDGARALVAAVGAADAATLPTWLGVVGAVRPVPKGALDAVLARWSRAAPAEREALAGFLATGAGDLAAAGPELAAFVADRLGAAGEAERARWTSVAARLPAIDGPLADRLLQTARTGPADAAAVLAAFGAHGERARPVAPRLLELASAQPEEARAAFAQGLAAIGGDDVARYAAERLVHASDAERDVWVEGLRATPDPSPLVAPLLALARGADEGRAVGATLALVRVTATSVPDAARPALVALVEDPRVAVRGAAISALATASAWPEPVGAALVRALDDPVASVRAGAVSTLSEVWRMGAAAAPWVPALLRIAGGADGGVPFARAGALRSLAAAAPEDPRARAAFVAAAGDAAPHVRFAAVAGLSALASPTPAEKAAVAARKDDPALAALVAATLSRASWQAVR